jgi:hypothetical protein
MNKNKANTPQDNQKTYLKYIGLSFQLFGTIGLGTWLGWYFQESSSIKFPIWIITGCFLSTFIALYHLYISVKDDSKQP